MNEYLKNLSKIEFVVTYACTGRCKHCSEGEHTVCGESVSAEKATEAIRKIASEYPIKTVMTFGGEPLLFPETVFAIMRTAKELKIERRQVITNGYFSESEVKINEVAQALSGSGVNELLLSVDAFHAEYIPTRVVKFFAKEVKKAGIPTRLSPAFLVSREDDNPYNIRTREILKEFVDLGLEIGEGNIVFPEGNALKYLSEYFVQNAPRNPYTEDPCDVKCISFEPDGTVLQSNVYKNDIMDILESYNPKRENAKGTIGGSQQL